MASPGRDANHPDVAALLARTLTEWDSHGAVAAEQIAILQQRSLYGADTAFDTRVAESAGLALVRRSGQPGDRDLILVFLCVLRERDGEWNLAGAHTSEVITDSPRPHAGGLLLGPRWVICGSVVSSPVIGAVRATLPDGAQYEDAVADGSFLLFAPLRTPAAQAGTLTLQILDRAGVALSTDRHQLPYGKAS
jgi:hypothetical protein